MIPKPVQYILGCSIAAMLVIVPIAYSEYREEVVRNFHVVEDGVLYRSGQNSTEGLKSLLYDHNIKTVISCRFTRTPGTPHPDKEEEEFCKKHGIQFYRIPYKKFYETREGVIPADENAAKFRKIMSDPDNHPVLVHCFAGKHRTGALCAIYRIEFNGWDRERVIREMIECGYDNIHEHKDLLGYILNYEPKLQQH